MYMSAFLRTLMHKDSFVSSFVPTPPHNSIGLFHDQGMIYALQKFEEDPCTMQSLAETALAIWADLEGDLPPTATELGCYFRTEDEWLTAVDTTCASGGARAP